MWSVAPYPFSKFVESIRFTRRSNQSQAVQTGEIVIQTWRSLAYIYRYPMRLSVSSCLISALCTTLGGTFTMHSVAIPVDLSSILEEKSASLVVAYFFTKGYEPCTRVEGILKESKKKFDKVTFVHVDADSSTDLTEEYVPRTQLIVLGANYKSVLGCIFNHLSHLSATPNSSLFQHKVTSVPTCLFFKQKSVVDRFQGVDEGEIGKLLEKHASTEPEAPSEKTEEDPTKEASPEPSKFSEGFLQGLWNPQVLQESNTYLPPKHMLDDIHAQLSIVLSPTTQSRAARSDKDKPVSEPSLTLYCPLEGGEHVVDATVQALADRCNADILMLDLSQLVIEQWSGVWKDLIKPREPSENPERPSSPTLSVSSTDEEVGLGYLSTPPNLDTEKLKPFAKEIINSGPTKAPGETSEPETRPRIVYMRDFGVVATLAPALYAAMLVEVQKTVPGPEAKETKTTPTAIILGTSPFLKWSGLLQEDSGSSSKSSPFDFMFGSKPRSDSSEDNKPEKWDESDDAQNARELRNQKQYNKWKKGSLSKHVESQLSKTDVFTGITGSTTARHKYSRVCIVVPATRDLAKERAVREQMRINANNLQMRMALLDDEAELNFGPSGPQGDAAFVEQCRAHILDSNEILTLVDRALVIASDGSTNQSPKVSVTWDVLSKAWDTVKDLDKERLEWIKNSKPKGLNDQGKDDLVDEVKAMDLSQYERDMLRCLIKPDQLKTTFDSVHLPAETIDVVRSLVSLPLICPDAFQTGLLKEHNMTGALFFGPPGTGKTHFARAIAKESGARMIAVKPSDIMDKYVGESEKIISGLFQLARRLKPCIVFIDEIDSLFGARTSKSCSPWRTDMLTQFAQEMDGMHVSDVVVIGTTNRPFDLDDAMVRRLPCRVLIDLPDDAAREAILNILLKNEQLESDVDIKYLARQTSRYSGSDLKSLCVMAAYESAKESAKVPWSTSKPKSDSPLARFSPSGTLTPAPTDSGRESPDQTEADSSVEGKSVHFLLLESKSATSKPRTLAKRHFTHALAQVRASTSESQESSVQLRKWNEQFGSANQKKRVEVEPPRTFTRPYTEPGSYLRQLGVA
ncbi:unnamed protein product [Rhizoctonia solani]|uniref:AAA+ ATPase domain-containing protein n=1 Tax=Rhizoctonia solani TaxID=456999 RepID=A0A8H3I1U6_9AGAM|nr:unnamed protein product [Rhizoctonia solani]